MGMLLSSLIHLMIERILLALSLLANNSIKTDSKYHHLSACKNHRYLQQIGTFDIPKIFVIYWHICNFGKMQIISINHNPLILYDNYRI